MISNGGYGDNYSPSALTSAPFGGGTSGGITPGGGNMPGGRAAPGGGGIPGGMNGGGTAPGGSGIPNGGIGGGIPGMNMPGGGGGMRGLFWYMAVVWSISFCACSSIHFW